ncbi:hypothetical protein FQZ97_882150 [compost metagenome]
MYAVLMSVAYSTAKRVYSDDRAILGVVGRKLTVGEYCRLYGSTLAEVNEAYRKS